MASPPASPYDAELSVALAQLPTGSAFTKETLPMLRSVVDPMYTAGKAIAGRQISHEDRIIPGPRGDIKITIFKPITPGAKPKPGIYFIHGGGMIMGTRFLGGSLLCDWVDKFGAVGVAVEYRLAPENPYPAALEDCQAGLKWVSEHLGELGIDPDRLMLAGQSAGAGLSASLALTIRDKGGPKLRALCLMCPMLDDRNNSLSTQQFATGGTWTKDKNEFGWSCLLGESAGSEGVSKYAAAARETDHKGLPPTYLDAGSAEPFRDETVAFANGIWKAGGQADLHIWDGGFHGFDMMAPSAKVSVSAINTRLEWVGRVLV